MSESAFQYDVKMTDFHQHVDESYDAQSKYRWHRSLLVQ